MVFAGLPGGGAALKPGSSCRSLPPGSHLFHVKGDRLRSRHDCAVPVLFRTRGFCMLSNRLLTDCRLLLAGTSRRDVLRGLTVGFGLGGAHLTLPAEAKKKRKRKKKQKAAKPNQFGCFEVGAQCKSGDDCCAGVCEGKKCRAHGTDICRQDKPGVCTAGLDEVPSLGCGPNCWCFRTTAGSNFCGANVRTSPPLDCTSCRKDADCIALGYPPGSACAPVGSGNCSTWCDTGMACLVPCGTPYPEEKLTSQAV